MRDIDRKILALALPSIAANITTPLLGLVDTAITGHLRDAVYIGAIAVGASMFNMLYWLFGFLRMGTSGMTARSYGAGAEAESSLTLMRGVTVAFAVALAMIVLQRPICDLLLWIMETDAATSLYAARYFDVVIYGAPAMLGTYVFTGWLLGNQDSRATLYVSLIVNVVNIVTSLTLVYAAGMGADGVAVGTLTAQWSGFVAGAVMIARRHHPRLQPWRTVLDRNGIRSFFGVNTDIFLRTVCLVVTTMWFTRAGAAQGATVLAANAVLMQFFVFFSYFVDGFAYAGEAVVGRYTGAGDRQMLRCAVRRLLIWGGAVALVFTVCYAAGGSLFLGLLTSHADVVDTALEYRWWVVSVPLAGFMAFTWDGVFIGAAMQRKMLLSMLVATVLFFVLYYALVGTWHNHALWLAFTAYLLARGLMQTWFYRRRVKAL